MSAQTGHHSWWTYLGLKACKHCGQVWNTEGPNGACLGDTERGRQMAKSRSIGDACMDGEHGDELFDRINYLRSL